MGKCVAVPVITPTPLGVVTKFGQADDDAVYLKKQRPPYKPGGRRKGFYNCLSRVLHSPRLPDDGHLDLPRILHILLDTVGDVAGQQNG